MPQHKRRVGAPPQFNPFLHDGAEQFAALDASTLATSGYATPALRDTPRETLTGCAPKAIERTPHLPVSANTFTGRRSNCFSLTGL